MRIRCGVFLVLVLISAGCGPRPRPEGPWPPAATQIKKESSDGARPLLRELKLSLPDGWRAEYVDALQQWTVRKDMPPDFPEVLIRSLPPEQAPQNLRDFVNTLETSSTMTQGTRYLVRAREQARFGDGYYAAGKFRPRGTREEKDTGFAMIRHLGGHTLIFECYRINDVNLRQQALEFCKAAKF